VIAHVETIPQEAPSAAPASEPPSALRARTRSSKPGGFLHDLVALTKPRITATVVSTTIGGAWMAGRMVREKGLATPSLLTIGLAVLGTVLVVSGANTLNMYIERYSDRFMARTKNRPLPAGRMAPEVALIFGLLLSVISVPLLTFAVNAATGMLGAIALTSYVLLYTPLKRRTTLSLLIGAVPGAIPPLLGWTAITGRIDLPGLLLFGVLFFWQVPHFLAIAVFRREEYRRAGLKILPVERGEQVTRHHIVGYLIALLLVTLLLVPAGIGGPVYFGSALVLGLVFLGFGLRGLKPGAGGRWARQLFLYSLAYLPLLLLALMVGA